MGKLSALASCAHRWPENKPGAGGVGQRGRKELNGILETRSKETLDESLNLFPFIHDVSSTHWVV